MRTNSAYPLENDDEQADAIFIYHTHGHRDSREALEKTNNKSGTRRERGTSSLLCTGAQGLGNLQIGPGDRRRPDCKLHAAIVANYLRCSPAKELTKGRRKQRETKMRNASGLFGKQGVPASVCVRLIKRASLSLSLFLSVPFFNCQSFDRLSTSVQLGRSLQIANKNKIDIDCLFKATSCETIADIEQLFV